MIRVLGILVVIWLLVGAFAAWQRDYFSSADTNCAEVSTTVVTIVAGPLNYFGVNPKLDCQVKLPEPSE
jgi:membrane protein YdbS with pleckstrin-like domain